ncbi:hypothetical protein V8B97DRAFT_1179458 [Scleroderma yunnanense]
MCAWRQVNPAPLRRAASRLVPPATSPPLDKGHDPGDASTSRAMHDETHQEIMSLAHADMDTYPHYIPALEREFCSNFACCGRSLSDLHELIDHFEEAHTLVPNAHGKIYLHTLPLSPASSLSSTSSLSSYSSSSDGALWRVRRHSPALPRYHLRLCMCAYKRGFRYTN